MRQSHRGSYLGHKRASGIGSSFLKQGINSEEEKKINMAEEKKAKLSSEDLVESFMKQEQGEQLRSEIIINKEENHEFLN